MNRDDIVRMAQKAGVPMRYSFVGGATRWDFDSSLEHFAKLIAAAEQKAVIDTVDELIGIERDRSALFSEGYDHALFHIKQFVEGRAKVK